MAVIPTPNLVEVLFRAPECGHRMAPSEIQDHALAMGLAVEPLTGSDVLRAAELIAHSRAARVDTSQECLSLGDGACLATAE